LLTLSLTSWLLALAPAQSSTIRNPQPNSPAGGASAAPQVGAPQGDDRQSHLPVSPDQAASVHAVLHDASVLRDVSRVEHPPGPSGPSSPASSPVPEPRTLLLVGTGLLGLGVLTQTNRRRRQPVHQSAVRQQAVRQPAVQHPASTGSN